MASFKPGESVNCNACFTFSSRPHARLEIAFADRIIFAISANVSIASLNLSLMINSVGFYQIAKLLIIPFTAVVQSVFLSEVLTVPQLMCTAAVLTGVAIVYVTILYASCT
jgi:solute carrier family 35, member E3